MLLLRFNACLGDMTLKRRFVLISLIAVFVRNGMEVICGNPTLFIENIPAESRWYRNVKFNAIRIL